MKELKALKGFYEKLGFDASGGDETQNWLIMRNGDHIIGLFQGMLEENLITFNPGCDQQCNTLKSFRDVRDLKTALGGKGLKIEMESESSKSGPASFFVTDPDGNKILFDQHI